ncbi:MAG: UDP-N-acetylmuramate dehydrogenase [Coprococcus sp.]|nr:UDP-N-acetylmuramate dehydrogenase [Coprococcus sp.]
MEQNLESFEEQLFQLTNKDKIKKNEPMEKHTTFRVGGPADYFLVPERTSEIADIVQLCRGKNVPYYVIGNGSNLLVGDKGYRGVVIQIYKSMSRIRIEGDEIIAQAGASLAQTACAAMEASLTGLEFASGIPGALGGAVVMNAGAYGGEMKDVLISADVLTRDGRVKTLTVEELELGYRKSVIPEEGFIVLEVQMRLKRGKREEIQGRMEELRQKRLEKQPLEYPSAGSTFKRPEGYFAGKLIQDAGLKGFRVGGAQVSEKHSGFIVNTGGATAAEIQELIRRVTAAVKEKTGVTLEPEVRRIGEF